MSLFLYFAIFMLIFGIFIGTMAFIYTLLKFILELILKRMWGFLMRILRGFVNMLYKLTGIVSRCMYIFSRIAK